MWKDLEHPNVAPLLGICFYPRICFVTPFYVNGNVVDFVKQSGAHGERKYTLVSSSSRTASRDVDANLMKMQDVILGLRYLHSKRIIHGDLKYVRARSPRTPQAVLIIPYIQDNVMVDHNSSGKIIDFGLAMTTQQAFGAITKAGVDRYTPSAAASSGKKAFVTDLYALGFILLEVRTLNCYCLFPLTSRVLRLHLALQPIRRPWTTRCPRDLSIREYRDTALFGKSWSTVGVRPVICPTWMSVTKSSGPSAHRRLNYRRQRLIRKAECI